MKKFWVTLLSALMIGTSVAFVAGCDTHRDNGGGESIFATYILNQSSKLIEQDFVLPLKVNDQEVEWSSSNTSVIEVEKREEDWLAKVTLADEQTNVTLTVSHGEDTKSFEVTVKAFDISYFTSTFKFAQEKTTVFADFDLPTTYSIGGKTASITWSVDRDQDKNYIAIVDGGETGKQCKVTQSSLNPGVTIFATFSYNGKTSKVPYRMTVSFERDHVEAVNYWYNNTGVSIEMSGYVVEIATAYSATYNNLSLYMVDDDFCAGYYLYRVKMENGADASLVKPGVHITVTGTTNTIYNGLYETNSDGTLVVDKDKPALTAEQLAASVAKIDDELLAGDPAAINHTSSLVSLEKWTVKSVESKAPAAGSAATLFTLTKGGVNVSIGVSKYLEGAYAASADNDTWKALAALQGSIKEGDVVSVTGILGNYKGYQILPLTATAVKKEEGAATEANADLKKVGTAVKDVVKIMTDEAGYIIVADKDITVPAEKDGVTIGYEVLRDSPTVSFKDGKISVKVGTEDKAVVKVTYTLKAGDKIVYTTTTFHEIHSKEMSDDTVASTVLFDLELPDEQTATGFDLPTTVNKYPGATISWALKAPVDGVTVSEDGKKLVVVPSTTIERNITLVATVGYNTAEPLTKEFTIKVIKVDPVKTGTFVMFMDIKSEINKKLYFTGEFDGSYGATSDSPYDAAQVVIEEATDGYTMKVNGKYLELNSSHLIVLSDTQTGVWGYDYILKVFTWDVKDYGVCVIGTYTNNNKTYTTISASKVSYIQGDNASKIGVSQYPVSFEKPTEDKRTDAQKAEAALAKVAETMTVTKAGETVPPVSSVAGVTLAWTVKEGTTLPEGVTLAEGKLNVATLPAEDAEVKLTLTATCGSETKTKEVTVTIKAEVKEEDPTDLSGTYNIVLDLTAAADQGKKYYFSGAIDGNYAGTTDDATNAGVVVIAKAEGGYHFTVDGKYLELVRSGNYANPKLLDTAGGVWQYNSELKTFTWTAADNTVWYLGTYTKESDSTTRKTIGASQISYITGDNASKVGVTQFVVSFDLKLTGTYNIVLDLTAAADQGKTYYFSGAIDGNYAGTTDDATNAGVVVISEAEGGYHFTVDGKYLELVRSGNYANPKLLDTAGGVWQYNSELKTFTWTAADNTVWYLGTYTKESDSTTRKTIGASQISYITGDNASKVGVTQFVVNFVAVTVNTPEPEPTPSTEEAKSINFDDMSGAVADGTKIADIFTLHGEKWTVDANSGDIADAAGNAVSVANRLKSGATSATMDVDLTAYTGKVQLQFFVRTGKNGENERGVSLKNSAGTELGQLILTVDTMLTFDITVDGGAVYTLSNIVGSVNFYGINVIPQAASNPPEEDTTNYGTKDAPLSVTEALAIAEKLGNDEWTAQVVYMKGIAKATAVISTNGQYYQSFNIIDENDSTKEILVYSINLRDGIAAPVQNDVVVISGYITNFKGNTIEFSRNTNVSPTVEVYLESNTTGTSTVTLGAHEGATVTGLPETATNGTEVTFTVTAADNKEIVSVKVNGTAIEATEGTYKFTVAGNATVTVETKDEGAADAEVLYTLSTSTSGSNSGYAGNCDVAVSGITWNIEGNSTMDPWRFGGRNLDAVDRKLTGKTAISGKITKLEIAFGAATITVNSVTLKVYSSDPTADGATEVSSIAVDFNANTKATVMADKDWTGCYYQLVFNVTNSGGSNQYVTVPSIAFYGFAA